MANEINAYDYLEQIPKNPELDNYLYIFEALLKAVGLKLQLKFDSLRQGLPQAGGERINVPTISIEGLKICELDGTVSPAIASGLTYRMACAELVKKIFKPGDALLVNGNRHAIICDMRGEPGHILKQKGNPFSLTRDENPYRRLTPPAKRSATFSHGGGK